MAAKLLNSLTDENPDLQKQIGCMTGVFQLFDPHHVLMGRRTARKRLTLGTKHVQYNNFERETLRTCDQERENDTKFNGSVNERQRLSTESSRLSFSSSCSSSLSSSDFNRGAQPDVSTVDRIVFPEAPSREPTLSEASSFNRSVQQSLDLRDVVKDSMYREVRGLAVQTKKKGEVIRCAARQREDSPRPSQLRSVNGKKNMPAELKESLRVLARLREAPQHYNDAKEPPRSSYETRERSWNSLPNEPPRFSVDSRHMKKSTQKLKELPRLSLDSRERVLQGSNSDSKTSQLSKSLSNGRSSIKVSNLPQSSKRPPNVVAKLMGLETLPGSPLARDGQSAAAKAKYLEDDNPFSRSLKGNTIMRPIRVSASSPRSSMRDPLSPRLKSSDFVMKPSNSKFPIEPAPWKLLDRSRVSQKPTPKQVKVPSSMPSTFPSVYGEIEKRLKDIEFTHSGKDLRALKQILEAMQAKSFLETQKEAHSAKSESQSEYDPRFKMTEQYQNGRRSRLNDGVVNPVMKDSAPPGTFDSPIVIMKPAKLIEKSGIPASSLIPIHSLSGLHRLPGHGSAESRRSSAKSHTTKDRSPRNSLSLSVSLTASKNAKSQQASQESASTSAKSSGSISPRLQQKKLEFDKRSRPPAPPDSSKPLRRTKKHLGDSASPGGKRRTKAHSSNQNEDQLSQISNDSRSSSLIGDDTSLKSESSAVLESKIDVEVTCNGQPVEINNFQSPSEESAECLDSTLMQKDFSQRSSEDGSSTTISKFGRDHPSPVSILDSSVLREIASSPVKPTSDNCKGAGLIAEESGEDQWNPAYSFSDNTTSGLSSEINRKKLRNVEHLVQKLRRLNSTHDEASQDYIASLCENTNPDHRYISEILLASGLLLRDLGSGLSTFQLHPSGQPINPEMFLVLEQTKGHNLLSDEGFKVSHSKNHHEKLHRRLLFDVVNEALLEKLASTGAAAAEPWMRPNKIIRKTLTAQTLLKELCSEIESLQAKKSEGSRLEEEEDCLKSVLWEDVMNRSGNWTDFDSAMSGVVLDIERLVFKDLINEIIHGEAAGQRTKPDKRRMLFINQ